MKEKRKAKKPIEKWCKGGRINIPGFDYSSKSDEKYLTLKKKIRCPECGKRMNIIMHGCQCCYPQSFVTIISPHRRKR